MNKQTQQAFPTIMLTMICLSIAIIWIFARFVHYHAQHQILAPAHYTANVIPATDRTTENQQLMDFKKSEDGQYYVRVTTLGTAHHIRRTTSDLMFPFIFALGGVIVAVWIRRKQKTESNQQVQATQ
jgi:hypothetical protein